MDDAVYETIAIDNIEATAATQVRVRLDRSTIEEYQEAIEAGAELPALLVFHEPNSERYILADGFHRLYAMVNLGWDKVVCEVREGRMVDALIEALGANDTHGLRRTNADKRHAVEMALKDPELSTRTAQEIADICRVTDRTVRRIIADHAADDGENDSQDRTKSGKKKVKQPDDDDVIDTGDVSQETVDLHELRDAFGLVKALPYSGPDAANRLDLTKDDIADAEYVSTWLAGMVVQVRKAGEDG